MIVNIALNVVCKKIDHESVANNEKAWFSFISSVSIYINH